MSKILLVTKICPYCASAKQKIKEKRISGIEILDAETPRGHAFAERHGVQYVPALFINGKEVDIGQWIESQ